MKKMLALLLFALTASFMLGFSVKAEEMKTFTEICVEYKVKEDDVINVFSEQKLVEEIYKSLSSCKNAVVLYSDVNIGNMTTERAKEFLFKALKSEKGTWLWGNLRNYKIGVLPAQDSVYLFYDFEYRVTKDEQDSLENALNKYIAEMKIQEDFVEFTDEQKAEFVYKKVMNLYEYDYELSDNAYHPYDALINNKGGAVCQAYSLTFWYLANALGLETKVVINEEETHSWNAVKIKDKWFYVDCTRGDCGDAKDWFLYGNTRDKMKEVASFYDGEDIHVSRLSYKTVSLFEK